MFLTKVPFGIFIYMQTITRGANTVLTLTLTERVTLTTPYFLVRMKSRSTNVTKVFILPSNQSSATTRYDKFTITETSGTEILTSGTVTLTAGDWNYDVYEQSSSTSLSVDSATTHLESGIFRVLGTGDTYVDSEDEITFIDG